MGSSMVGFLVAGPARLDSAKRAEAVELVKECAKICRIINQKIDEDEELTTEEIQFVIDRGIDADWEESIQGDLCQNVPDEDEAETFVDSFIDFWHSPEERDTTYRFYQGKTILFAGDSSWGDEPDGSGYTMLKRASLTGINKVFEVDI